MYMPSHDEDIRLIPEIMHTINTQINAHPNHIHTLCGDFNRDIALIGRQNGQGTTPPQEEDIRWRTYTDSLALTYIPTNTTYSRQGGHNYTHTSLIDGFYTNTQYATTYTSNTLQEQDLNSDHLPISLEIPPNTLLARVTQLSIPPSVRILNPIPQDKLNSFNTKFFEENAIQLNEITNLLLKHHLTPDQWQQACTQMDNITQKISKNIEETCSAPPIPTLTNRAIQQGGYLPRKIQKTWKQHITTYHLIRKTIYITKNLTNWRIHPIMDTLRQYSQIHIPLPPEDDSLINTWIKEIAMIAKTSNLQARKITTKFTKKCIKKAISKYRKLYESNPKRINRKVFKNLETPPLDCITDRNNKSKGHSK